MSYKAKIKKMLYKFGVNPRTLKFRTNEVDEALILEELFKNKKHGVIIDVGFAWGQVSLPFLIKKWKSYAFEPDKQASKLLAISEMTSIFCNLKVDNRAVSNISDEKLTFYNSEESEGISSLHSFRDHHPSHEVRTVTLDRVLKEENISEVDILKIDTEGHDLFVLKGLTFDKIKPKVILTEFDDFKTEKLGYKYQDIGDMLLEQEYAVYLFEWFPIKKYGEEHEFKGFHRYPTEMDDKNGWGNFIAVSGIYKDKMERLLDNKKYRLYKIPSVS